jgi:hypothetical protein
MAAASAININNGDNGSNEKYRKIAKASNLMVMARHGGRIIGGASSGMFCAVTRLQAWPAAVVTFCLPLLTCLPSAAHSPALPHAYVVVIITP